jgi:NAD(P)-dependent dehydrogenase (short-subunit alcohol dehydrogenase family)
MTRRAVVTGVCGGIGSAIAERLAASDWQVLGIDRAETGPSSCDRFYSFDLSEWRSLSNVLLDLVDGKPIDVLVNNAGVQTVQSIAEVDDDSLADTFAVNVFAPFAAIRALVPELTKTAGAVVNIASVHAQATSLGMSSYAASKSAQLGMTRAAAVDLAPLGIRVNAVLPGAIDTEMLRAGMAARSGGIAGSMSRLANGTPLGRIGLAREVADLVEYLADSRRSSFVTGQSYIIDGGALASLGSE